MAISIPRPGTSSERPKRPTSFFGLPPELRNDIYHRILIHSNSKLYVSFFRDTGSISFVEPTFLSASPRIRHEAAPIYYGAHSIEAAGVSAAGAFLRSQRVNDIAALRDFRPCCPVGSEQEFERTLHEVNMAVKSGKGALRPDAIRVPIWRLKDFDMRAKWSPASQEIGRLTWFKLNEIKQFEVSQRDHDGYWEVRVKKLLSFFDLPPEIRNMVYHFALTRIRPYQIRPPHWWPELQDSETDYEDFRGYEEFEEFIPALLSSHPVIRKEAALVFYANNTFKAKTGTFACAFLKSLSRDEAASIRDFRLSAPAPADADLHPGGMMARANATATLKDSVNQLAALHDGALKPETISVEVYPEPRVRTIVSQGGTGVSVRYEYENSLTLSWFKLHEVPHCEVMELEGGRWELRWRFPFSRLQ